MIQSSSIGYMFGTAATEGLCCDFQLSCVPIMVASAHVGCLTVLKRTQLFNACLCNAAGERHGVPRAPHPTQRATVLRQGLLLASPALTA